MAKRKKTGGRKKGTPNKLTVELREKLEVILSEEIEKIPELLEKTKPVSRLHLIAKLLPYILPVLSKEEQKLNLDDLTEDQIDQLFDKIIESKSKK